MADTSAKTKMILPFFQTKRATFTTIFVIMAVLSIGAMLFLLFSSNGNKDDVATEVATNTSTQAPADISPDLAMLIQKYPIILSDRCLSRLFGVNKQYIERYDGDVDVTQCPDMIPTKLKENGIPGKAVGAGMAMNFCLGIKKLDTLDTKVGDDCRTQVLETGYTSDYGKNSLPLPSDTDTTQAVSGG